MSYYTYLASFLAVYRARSFTRAAERLHLTQAAISKHVQQLEVATGTNLFRREPHGVVPTAPAHQLATALLQSFDVIDATWAAHQVRTRELAGPITIGGPPALLNSLCLPKLLPLIKEGIVLHCVPAESDALIAQFKQNQLDLIVTSQPLTASEGQQMFLRQMPLALVGHRKWVQRLATEENQKAMLQALSQADWLLYDAEPQFVRPYLEQAFGKMPPVNSVMMNADLHGLLLAARQGWGITVLPELYCREVLAQGGLVPLYQPAVKPTIAVYLYCQTARAAIPRVRYVMEQLLEKTKHLDAVD